MSDTTNKLKEILLYLKWGNISKDYFGFSRGWIYQRLNGCDGNGNECDFTDSQKETLKEALRDIAAKLNEAADNI
jgi:hypothetical protein